MLIRRTVFLKKDTAGSHVRRTVQCQSDHLRQPVFSGNPPGMIVIVDYIGSRIPVLAASNLNRSYFGRIFREAVGKSPQEFLISYRMTRATELLKLTELSISDIGNAVGYPNQLHFSRAFRSVYGISPRQWRSENKAGS